MSVRIESFFSENSFFLVPVQPQSDSLVAEAIPVAGSPSSTRMEFATVVGGEKRNVVFEGNFSYPNGAPKSTADLKSVSGEVTSRRFFLNDQLFGSDVFTPSVSLQQLINADSSLSVAQSVYGGDDVFIAAKNPGAKDQGDIVDGFGGNDTFHGHGSGSQYQDIFYGGTGVDTSVFDGPRGSYQIIKTSDVYNAYGGGRLQGYSITNAANSVGKQEVSAVERLKFSDGMVAIDMAKGENGYKAAMLTATVLGRNEINNYFDEVVALFDAGYSTADLAQKVVDAGLIEQAAGARSNSAFVSAIYKNVTGISPSTQDVAALVSQLDSGFMSRASLLVTVAEHVVVEELINLTGLQSGGIFYHP